MSGYTIIGELTGTLAPHFQGKRAGARFKGDRGLVMAGKTVGTLDSEGREAVRTAYQKGHPIVLVNGTVAHANQLHEIAGTGQRSRGPTDLAQFEAYGINLEPSGDTWQVLFTRPAETAKVALQIKHINDDGQTVVAENSLGTMAFQGEQTGDTAARVQTIEEWIAQAGQRKKPEGARAPETRTGDVVFDDSNSLTSLASAQVFTIYWTAGNPGQVNNYQVTSVAYSCYAQATNESWFYVQHFWIMSASNAYTVSGDQQNYWYADNYSMDVWPRDYLNDPYSVSVMQSSPFTTEGVTTTTSGVSYNVGGSVGYQDGGVVGSVSGGMTIENSTTINIPDVSVTNNTNNNGNNPNWTFTMPRCTGVDDGCVNSMTEPKAVSTGTFQPLTQWIWRAAASTYTGYLYMNIQLNMEWCNSYMGDCNIFGCNCDVDCQTWSPQWDPAWIAIPFPPTGE